MKASDILARLEGVRPISTGGHVAKCPAHSDAHASLKVDEGADGRVLAHCKAGCSIGAICAALGIEVRELMPERDEKPQAPVRVLHETPYKLVMPGGEVLEHVRLDLNDGGKRFVWRRGGKAGLGGLAVTEVPLYVAREVDGKCPAVVTEGEKASLAMATMWPSAYGTVCGASACPSPAVLGVLKGRDVALWPDADAIGVQHMRKIGEALKGIARSCSLITWGTEKGDDAADFVQRGGTAAEMAALIEGATRVWGAPKLKRLADGVKAALSELDRYTAHDWSTRVQTGIYELDQRMLGGLRPGRVTLLGAMTGAGKSTFAQQVAHHCARKQGAVLFVSPEMSVEELAEREIIRESGRSMQSRAPRNRNEREKDETIAAHSVAAGAITTEALPIYVLDDAATMDDVEAAAEAVSDLKLVIIDYAQEVADDADPRKARYLAVGDVARRGVRLAQRLNVPVLIASQLNAVKNKSGDTVDYEFRETRVLEQKASVVWIMVVTWDESPQRERFCSAKLICRKHRGGPTFTIELHYTPELFLLGAKADVEEHWSGRLDEVMR